MRIVKWTIVATLAAMAVSLALIPAPSVGEMTDEEAFVGEWHRDDDGETFCIEWRSDGTGTEWYEDSNGGIYDEYDFNWYLYEGSYWVQFVGESWYSYDYDFSSDYNELTLTDEYGPSTYYRENPVESEAEEESSLICCCCCGAPMLLPAGALASVAGAVTVVRKRD